MPPKAAKEAAEALPSARAAARRVIAAGEEDEAEAETAPAAPAAPFAASGDAPRTILDPKPKTKPRAPPEAAAIAPVIEQGIAFLAS